MSKTVIDLDDDLVAEVARVLGTRTKADTVNTALREVLANRRRPLALTRLREAASMLAAARAAGTRLADAERTADVARAEFHHAVRRLQLAGGSESEIADALGLSYERVHQIAEGADGSWPSHRRVSRPGTLECSFCGKNQKQVGKLIAGPDIFICNECADKADRVIATGEVAATPLSAVKSVGADVTRAQCSFCGKSRHQVSGMALAAEGTICSDCLLLCLEIIAAELASD